jgi:glycosyltransferase involved in cell wall biosynthesis
VEHTQVPLVSICCLTYNHEPYLHEAIESFLMQETSFPVEIIIHDDASTDRTPEIIAGYDARYPGRFVCLSQSENQFSRGVRGITARIVLPHARGRYVALCEGDDYWTNRRKLQTQVDLLEANRSYSGSFHETQQLLEDGTPGRLFGKNAPDLLTAEETFSTLSPFHTSSLLFRNALGALPDWLGQVVSGDMALFSIISSFGPLKKAPGTMSVYRKHAGGMTSLPMVVDNYHEQRIELMNYLNAFHQFKYASKARKVIESHIKQLEKQKAERR